MKQAKLFLLLLLACLASCSDDDDDKNPPMPQTVTFTFENLPEFCLPVDLEGKNFYSAYGEGAFISYTDEATGLCFGINEGMDYVTGGTAYDLWNGGSVASQNNELTQNNYQNQTSVYYADAKTSFGGAGGSKTFGIITGSTTPGTLWFRNGEEKEILNLAVCNTTYTALTILNGNDYASALNKDNAGWLKVTAEGFTAAGKSTGTAEYYLADFRTAQSPGLAMGWNKFNLSSLGKVNKVTFTFSGSDTGGYGLNTPAYMAVDDVVIVKE